MCCRDAQAAILRQAERALKVMQKNGLYRPMGDVEAAVEWRQAYERHQAALRDAARLARNCCE